MSKVKHLIGLVVAILLVAFVIVFTLQNDQRVSLIIFLWSTPQASVGVYVVLAFLMGCCIGPLLGWLAVLGARRAPKASFRAGR